MRAIVFLGSSLETLRAFPAGARQDAGYLLDRLQRGEQPFDFKPMPLIGNGVEELRIWNRQGTFRVVYVARFEEAVYVLHAFQKKTQRTARLELEVARRRFDQMIALRRSNPS